MIKKQDFFISIENIKNDIDNNCSIEDIHKYIIYFTLFDVLGNYAFPKKKHNEKYKELIQCYSNWKYKNYISSQQLKFILDKINEPSLRKILRKKIDEKFLPYIYSPQTVKADKVDFTEKEIKKILNNPQSSVSEESKKNINRAKYDNLFYKLRCEIVHEHKILGDNPFEDIDKDSLDPLYFCFIVKSKNEYALWLPPKLIPVILGECIKNMKRVITYNYVDIRDVFPKCWI
ncbi:MAG: hypothetical protein PHW73_02915 [Atribacterota bacterium]|nr:hypothetical protein [Atribacterota bacterium]